VSPGSADTVCPRPPLSLTFDHLTLKLLQLRWETFLPNLGMLGLWVLKLFATYAVDRQTDRVTDRQKQRLLPLPYSGGSITTQAKCKRDQTVVEISSSEMNIIKFIAIMSQKDIYFCLPSHTDNNKNHTRSIAQIHVPHEVLLV